MVNQDQVPQLVYKAIDEVNASLDGERQIEKSLETVLTGDSGDLEEEKGKQLFRAHENLNCS